MVKRNSIQWSFLLFVEVFSLHNSTSISTTRTKVNIFTWLYKHIFFAMQIFVTPTKSCYNIYRKIKGTSESERTREREEELKKKNRNHDSLLQLKIGYFFSWKLVPFEWKRFNAIWEKSFWTTLRLENTVQTKFKHSDYNLLKYCLYALFIEFYNNFA